MPPARKRPRSVADLEGCAWEDPQLGALAQAIGEEVAALHGLQQAVAAPGSLAQPEGRPANADDGTSEGQCEPQRGLQARARRLGRNKRPRFDMAEVRERLAQFAACAIARLELPDFTKMQRQQARHDWVFSVALLLVLLCSTANACLLCGLQGENHVCKQGGIGQLSSGPPPDRCHFSVLQAQSECCCAQVTALAGLYGYEARACGRRGLTLFSTDHALAALPLDAQQKAGRPKLPPL